MKLNTIYKRVDELSEEAYIKVCILIKDVLIKNNINKWVCGFSIRDNEGNYIDTPEEIIDLIEKYEDHFGFFDPQVIFEDGEINAANYIIPKT